MRGSEGLTIQSPFRVIYGWVEVHNERIMESS